MKNRKLTLAILAMVVATVVSVAIVSCKKEPPSALQGNTAQPAKTFVVPNVDDMNAYLKDFKKKMQSSTRGDEETLSLDEAAWHLSSVANYDFAKANVEFTNLRYDTLYYHVNVTNGSVSMTNINAVYQSMANDIDSFYQNLNLQEKHFRFIGVSVSENGQVMLTIITSYVDLNHTWYFDDGYEATDYCLDFFDSYTYYIWNTTAISQLEYAINLLEGRDYIMPGESHSGRVYYVYSTDLVFNYDNYIDPYPNSSPFILNSRIFAAEGDTWSTPRLDFNAMCYCLDSYLELPFEYIAGHANYGTLRPVNWQIEGVRYEFPDTYKWDIFCHIVTVKLAQVIASQDPIQY
ncbi:MAG: hypothetical protein IJ057_00795 [Bacteroidales bacterium]|nr:hypothetical protein [Bacteroidales bacterium]